GGQQRLHDGIEYIGRSPRMGRPDGPAGHRGARRLHGGRVPHIVRPADRVLRDLSSGRTTGRQICPSGRGKRGEGVKGMTSLVLNRRTAIAGLLASVAASSVLVNAAYAQEA